MVPHGTLSVRVNPKDPDKDVIAYAAGLIRRGDIVAFPTETVYGLAVNRLNPRAVDRLYGVKKRSRGKPFTVHISDPDMVGKMGCRLTKRAKTLIERFWPGPLTLILKSKSGEKIGFRMPANTVAIELIKAAGVPVIAPSANLSGNRPPTDAGQVMKDMDGKIDMLIDSGPCSVGVESTVVDITGRGIEVLREGAISPEALRRALEVK